MAFESLSDKLQNAFKKLTGRGKLNEKDIKTAMREVKLALLEADVNFLVVKNFIKDVTERAIGQDVLNSLTPGQQVVKIVNEELTSLMGKENTKLNISPKKPTVIMLLGLQGAGKTTMAGKLAGMLKKQNKKVLLAACDIYRPAAIKQLQVLGEQLDVSVYEKGTQKPMQTAKEAYRKAQDEGTDFLIIDTAGRLHIDEELMSELTEIKQNLKPSELLLVVDAMTGQDAVNVAEKFNNDLDITGVIITKLDGDTRGGAALSIRAVTGKPIKFAGIGEKLTDIEPFYPERMASRILGMGDVLTLIEKAESAIDEEKAKELEEKIKSQKFSLDDFLEQFSQMRKMGSMNDIMGMLPGVSGKMANAEIDEKQIDRMEAIIKSMTMRERENPNIINASRKKRIAAGSGTKIQDVNKLLNQFEATKKMMKQFTDMSKKGKKGLFKLPF